LLCGLLLGLILLPCAVFAAEFGGINIPSLAERERSAPATFPDKARFTLSPGVRNIHSALLQRASLLAQNASAPLPAVSNVNLTATAPPWGAHESYLIPALEIVGFDLLLNLFDRAYYGCCDYDVDLSSIKRNLHRGWDVDRDEFTVNQIGHPYQGSMYHGFARASGLNYWQGLAYTFVGSAFWEVAGRPRGRPKTIRSVPE
jgi:hypothetical protein